MQWNSLVLGFFFLDRASELWGPVAVDRSTGTERIHCLRAESVKILDLEGRNCVTGHTRPHSVQIHYHSHKGDKVAQGTEIRLYRSGDPVICPVIAASHCLAVRERWLLEGKVLGPYLTSVSKDGTVLKRDIAKLLKDAAKSLGLDAKDYASHSLRIGGACALLASGQSELVIKLMGRWASWCFTVYTRLRPGMLRDTASRMIIASSWDVPGQCPAQVGDSSESSPNHTNLPQIAL